MGMEGALQWRGPHLQRSGCMSKAVTSNIVSNGEGLHEWPFELLNVLSAPRYVATKDNGFMTATQTYIRII